MCLLISYFHSLVIFCNLACIHTIRGCIYMSEVSKLILYTLVNIRKVFSCSIWQISRNFASHKVNHKSGHHLCRSLHLLKDVYLLIDRSMSWFSGGVEHTASVPGMKQLEQLQDVESALWNLQMKTAQWNVRRQLGCQTEYKVSKESP